MYGSKLRSFIKAKHSNAPLQSYQDRGGSRMAIINHLFVESLLIVNSVINFQNVYTFPPSNLSVAVFLSSSPFSSRIVVVVVVVGRLQILRVLNSGYYRTVKRNAVGYSST
jgi:hypothetical protein